MAQQYCVGPVMMIDWEQDDSPPKLERWLLHRVFGDFRPYWRRGALALAWILGQSLRGLAPAVQDTYLFHASVRENLLYARRHRRDARGGGARCVSRRVHPLAPRTAMTRSSASAATAVRW